jgi:hypothetical protein
LKRAVTVGHIIVVPPGLKVFDKTMTLCFLMLIKLFVWDLNRSAINAANWAQPFDVNLHKNVLVFIITRVLSLVALF